MLHRCHRELHIPRECAFKLIVLNAMCIGDNLEMKGATAAANQRPLSVTTNPASH